MFVIGYYIICTLLVEVDGVIYLFNLIFMYKVWINIRRNIFFSVYWLFDEIRYFFKFRIK